MTTISGQHRRSPVPARTRSAGGRGIASEHCIRYVGEVIYVDDWAWFWNAKIHQPDQFSPRWQPPVVMTAEAGGIDRRDIALGIAADATAAAAAFLNTVMTTIGSGIRVIPTIGIVLIAQAAVVGMDFPQQAGDIVLDAAPLRRRGGQRLAAGIDLGKAETGKAIAVVIGADIGVSPRLGILPREARHRAGQRPTAGIGTTRHAGVVQLAGGNGQDGVTHRDVPATRMLTAAIIGDRQGDGVSSARLVGVLGLLLGALVLTTDRGSPKFHR